jgi:endonuclease III
MKKGIASIIKNLKVMHGEPRCELNYRNPLELIVATVLSAQCTDERVNKVTATLFDKYRTLADYAAVPVEVLEEEIRPTGFFHNKARSIKNIVREIEGRFEGRIPDDIDTFATVKGIGRKSANMIVGLAFGKPAVIVDTHMVRVTGRLGLTKNKDPERIEEDLRALIPPSLQTDFSLLVVLHGRYRCTARNPGCPDCLLKEDCDYWQALRRA